MRKVLLVILLFVVFGCNDKNQNLSQITDSAKGVEWDKLSLAYNGPRGLTLDYWPSRVIEEQNIKECRVYFIDSNDKKRLVRTVHFNSQGNVIDDDYSYFQAEEGTMPPGKAVETYNDRNYPLTFKRTDHGNSEDSFLLKWNYNKNGLLNSRDEFEYSRRVVAERYIDKTPLWHFVSKDVFSQNDNEITINASVENKVVKTEKYVLSFDSIGRLIRIEKSDNDSNFETSSFVYSSRSLQENVVRRTGDRQISTYKSEVILDSLGNQIQKIHFEKDGAVRSKTIIEYNDNGTIKRVKNGWIQEFEYLTFSKAGG